MISAGQLQRAGKERGKTGKGGNSGTEPHTAISAAANYDNTEETPLFP